MQRRRSRRGRGAWRPYLAVGPVSLGYGEALDLQARVQEARLQGRVPDVLLLCEHPPTVTLGRSVPRELRVRSRVGAAPLVGSPEQVAGSRPISQVAPGRVHEAPRGGGVALCGPGVLTGYMMASLKDTDRSLLGTLERVERSLCRLLGEFRLVGERVAGVPGIWVEGGKLVTLGLGLRGHVTGFGFGLPVSPDLPALRSLVPEDVEDEPVTSLGELLGADVPDLEDVSAGIFQHFATYLELRTRRVSLAELETELS